MWTSWPSKNWYFSYVKCFGNICSGLKIVKITFLWLVYTWNLSDPQTLRGSMGKKYHQLVQSVSHTLPSGGVLPRSVWLWSSPSVSSPIFHSFYWSINLPHSRPHSHFSSAYWVWGGRGSVLKRKQKQKILIFKSTYIPLRTTTYLLRN